LAIGQVPRPDDERQHIADQEKVEEVEHVAQDGGDHDLPLVERQSRLPLDQIQHVRTPAT
jgi:hypothetical protein